MPNFWENLTRSLGEARDAKIGAVGASEIRDAYARGDDEWAHEMAGKLVNANLTGITSALGMNAYVTSPLFRVGTDAYFGYKGAQNLISDNGVAKTVRLAKDGDTWGTVKSATGDVLDFAFLGNGLKTAKQLVVPTIKGIFPRNFNWLPEKSMETVTFTGNPIDTSDPAQRQRLIAEYQKRYPEVQLGAEKEVSIGGDDYYEIGKFAKDAAIDNQKEVIASRLDDMVPDWRTKFGYYRDPNSNSANMFSGDKLFENVGTDGVHVLIPKTQEGYFGGFYMNTGSHMGNSYINANPYRRKPAPYTRIHESVSHPTDDFVLKLKPEGSDKNFQQLYEEISQPKDLFPDYEKIMITGDSREAWEARALNQEMIYRINKNLARPEYGGITWENSAKNSEHLKNFVDTKLKDDSELVRFLNSMDSAYARDYARLLEKYAGTSEAHTYADRIRNMMKTLPAVVGATAGASVLANQNTSVPQPVVY